MATTPRPPQRPEGAPPPRARLIGHPVVDAAGVVVSASTAAGRGPSEVARVRARMRPAPPRRGEVPQAATGRSPLEGQSISARNGTSWSGHCEES